MFRLAIVTLGFTATVSGFSIDPRLSATGRLVSNVRGNLLPLSSEPSDSSSDDTFYTYEDAVDTTSKDYTPTPGEAMVTNVMDLMPSQIGFVSDETRAAINEALYKLEALNPTKAPTVSPMLNGIWELRYVGGFTPDWALPSPTGQFALFSSPGIYALSLAQRLPSNLVDVGDLEISISREQPRVEATVSIKSFGNTESDVCVKARMETQTDVRLRETFESATVLGRTVDLPKPLQFSRDMYVTYVDEDLLVIRDASGVPEVLVRKEKQFSRNWGTEPSSLDDMGPPGTPDGQGPTGEEVD